MKTNDKLKQILEAWDNEDDSIEIIEDGDWVSDYKYELRTSIVAFEGKYYAIHESRSGSYHSDYEYGDPEINEVTPKQVTITDWVAVK